MPPAPPLRRLRPRQREAEVPIEKSPQMRAGEGEGGTELRPPRRTATPDCAKDKTTNAPDQEAPAAEHPQSFRSHNRVQLAGRLVADPDLKYTPSGKAVCRMRVATNDTRVAQFHDIVAWEKVAETAAESLRKGAAVTVEGRLQTVPGRRPTDRPERALA